MDHTTSNPYYTTWQLRVGPTSQPGQYEDFWEPDQPDTHPKLRLDHGSAYFSIPSQDHLVRRGENSLTSPVTDFPDYLDEYHDIERQSEEEDIYETIPDLQENNVAESSSVLSTTEKVVLVDRNEGEARTFIDVQSVADGHISIYPPRNLVPRNQSRTESMQYPAPSLLRPLGDYVMPYEPQYSPRPTRSTPESPTPLTRLPSAVIRSRRGRLSTPYEDDLFRIMKYRRPVILRGNSTRRPSPNPTASGQLPVYDDIGIQQAQSRVPTPDQPTKHENRIPHLGQEVEDIQETEQAPTNENLPDAENTPSKQGHHEKAKANEHKSNKRARNRKALVEARIDQLLAKFGVQLKSTICKEQEVGGDIGNYLQGPETI